MARSRHSTATQRGKRAETRAASILTRALDLDPDQVHQVVAPGNFRGRQDMFGIADVVALDQDVMWLLQVTHDTTRHKRFDKVERWLSCFGLPGYARIEVWTWCPKRRSFRRFAYQAPGNRIELDTVNIHTTELPTSTLRAVG